MNPDVVLVVTLFAVVAVAGFRLGYGRWRPGPVDLVYVVAVVLVAWAVLA